jgi:hypothetical protein
MTNPLVSSKVKITYENAKQIHYINSFKLILFDINC